MDKAIVVDVGGDEHPDRPMSLAEAVEHALKRTQETQHEAARPQRLAQDLSAESRWKRLLRGRGTRPAPDEEA